VRFGRILAAVPRVAASNKEGGMMRKNVVACLFVCVAVLAAVSVATAGDAWIGTWKLDMAASKFSPGPAPKSQMIKFEAVEGGTMVASETMTADGKTMKMSYVSKFDGADVPWAGNPNADMSSAKRIDANTYENVWKKGGKATIHAKVTVSADGKTLTITQMGTDAEGKAVNNVAVYHRQ
jgi:hypothetical protein